MNKNSPLILDFNQAETDRKATFQQLLEAANKDPAGTGDDTGAEYLFGEQANLAVSMAIATGRPLLIHGPTGCGKSSLAEAVARGIDYHFVRETITSRTRGQDLLWKVDEVSRLADAQANVTIGKSAKAAEIRHYLTPGPLWLAFDLTGATDDKLLRKRIPDRDKLCAKPNKGVVVLLDEIDKADPSLPNDLLVPLGSFSFHCPLIEKDIRLNGKQPKPLIIITSNNERDLPQTFLRRVILLPLPQPHGKQELELIAKKHFKGKTDPTILDEVTRWMVQRIAEAEQIRREEDEDHPIPSTAEYLDLLRVCSRLSLEVGEKAFFDSDLWKWVIQGVMSRNLDNGINHEADS